MYLRDLKITASLDGLPEGKLLVNTINAWSFVVARKDEVFARALKEGDALIPDGKSIVWASRLLKMPDAPSRRIAGWDLFVHEMGRLNVQGGKCLFMGSSENVLSLIRERALKEYPNVEVLTYSPPFKSQFDEEDSAKMINAINASCPDLLWIGMTAPKQEKWVAEHWNELDIHCHCGTVGAVFDFYAGTAERAPVWMQKAGLEWLHRLSRQPGRLWKRYLVGNTKFIYYTLKEKFSKNKPEEHE